MKNLILGLALISLFACSDESDPGTGNTDNELCSAAEMGSTQCSDGAVQECNGTSWEDSKDCSAIGQPCVDDGAGTASCLLPGDPCPATDVGQSRCEEDVVEICNGTIWTTATDCIALSETCHQLGVGLALCADASSLCALEDAGRTRCDAAADNETLETCNGAMWVTSTDCAVNSEICADHNDGAAFCGDANEVCDDTEEADTRCRGTL
ncbi:hypothetical protein KAI87_10140, partial [Myxococcota bacterium]|nr:hypothetical protein [Myxococcota bacterium]